MSEDADELEYRSALATENWDAPVIVTTAVQFFESLYANRSSKCRKLHNIANSVIIFDEAQMIPSNNLRPCVAAIAELVRAYNATAVLCTATQPAIDEMLLEYSKKESVVELCPDVDGMFEKFRRTSFEKEGRLTTDELVSRLESQQQVLCIVNTRKFAQEVYEALPSEGRFHLSTLMCPVHRKQKLDEIRERLKSGKTCRVVSTSLIEAGVDVDFPRVFREMAGLDSILQAAGRCNREGKRSAESSIVTVFESENKVNKLIAVNRDAAEEAVRDWIQPNNIQTIECYFKAYRDLLRNDDKSEIMKAIKEGISGCQLPFKQIAERFRLIDENTFTVYISVGEGKELISRLREGERSRELYRKAGMYSVSIYENHFNALINAGAAEQRSDRPFCLRRYGSAEPLHGGPGRRADPPCLCPGAKRGGRSAPAHPRGDHDGPAERQTDRPAAGAQTAYQKSGHGKSADSEAQPGFWRHAERCRLHQADRHCAQYLL